MKTLVSVLVLLSIVIGCSDDDNAPTANGPRLKSVITHLQTQSGEFRPGEKVEYFYSDAGVLTRREQSQYDVTTKAYFPFSTTTYFYKNGNLYKEEQNIFSGSKKIVTTYEYTGNKVIRIIEDNDVDTEASIQYLSGNRVEVVYRHSNNRWFTYRFTLNHNNKEFEQILGEDSQVNSEVTHEYDTGKNPLTLLGYTDLFFTNISANNRVKTSSEYYSGAFPQSTPVSYTYEYNEQNYPTQQITTYQSLSTPAVINQIKVTYEYW
jgi:hypothetical protein